jgi:methionyl-tRNA formyltransferase
MSKINLIFFGSHPWFSLPILKTLIKSPKINLLAWVTKQGLLDSLEKKPNILTITVNNLNQIKKILNTKYKILDTILLAGYGPPFLDQELLNLPLKGCLNLHPSLLPKYPGASPVHTALKNNDQITGITLIKMTKTIDNGPIIAQAKFPIKSDHNLKTLTQDLGKVGVNLYLKSIQKYLNDQLKLTKQSPIPNKTYTQRLTKNSGQINWQLSPESLHNFIRSVTPWPGAWTPYQNQSLKILQTHLEKNQLIIDTIQLPGKSPISYQQFLAGHPDYQPLI